MGRASNAKKRRREAARSAAPLADIDRASAVAVLSAASVSPTACQRQPSLALATAALYQSGASGRRVLGADGLGVLLAAGEQLLKYGGLEGDEPHDVRDDVRVRWGPELFRIAPGGWERPVSIIEDARSASRAFDAAIDAALSFRLRDVVELGLRFMDETLGLLAPAWPPQGGSILREARVCDDEVARVLAGPSIESVATRCTDPKRAARALAWASRRPDDLSADVTVQSGVFGAVLAVKIGSRFDALPVGFVLDGIYAAVEALSEVALRDAAARERWAALARRRLLHLLAGRGGPLAEGADGGAGAIVALQRIDDGFLLAADVAAVGSDDLGIEQAEERLRAIKPGGTVHSAGGAVPLAEDDTIIRLVVVVGATSLVLLRADEAVPVNVLPAEDLRWIVTAADRPEDLVMFLREWQTPTPERRFSFGAFDLWEVWKGNGGAFHRVGAPLTSVMFSPHHERAEWRRHSQLRWLESALLDAGLPGLTTWPEVNLDPDAGRSATLVDLARDDAVDIAVGADGRVLAVRYSIRRTSEVPPSNIAHAVMWKLQHLRGEADVLYAGETNTVRIEVREDADQTVPLAVERVGPVFVVAMGPNIADELVRDEAAVEDQLGTLLAAASGCDDGSTERFAAAWSCAPRAIAVDGVRLPQRARNPGRFTEPHGSLIAFFEHALAEDLLTQGVEPGTRRGPDARDLQSQRIHPVLQRLFDEAIAPFDATALVIGALEDLERAHYTRWVEEGHHARLASLGGRDIAHRLIRSRRDVTTAIRALSLVVEEVLRAPPVGSRRPRAIDLDAIYAVAYLLYESGVRSEAIHKDLDGAELHISDSYEFTVEHVPTDFDAEAFNCAVAQATAPARPRADVEDDADDTEEPTRSVVETLPRLAGLDRALRDELAFGLDALMAVLDAATGWEDAGDGSPVAVTSRAEVESRATRASSASEAEISASLDWLTLTGDDLRGEPLEHWELDRRAVRLATRPLAVPPADESVVCVAPWAAAACRKIVANHLADGRLPWPRAALPKTVYAALEAYRSERNRALESEVEGILRSCASLVVRARVKKPKVLGLQHLPRELDALCVDDARSRIWVVEVKDRAAAFSSAQVRNAIDDFHREDGYVDKLLGNVSVIRADAPAVASALGIIDANREWEVNGLMVTRRIEPAAFVADPRVPFCTVDAFLGFIDADVPPG